ncbi:MAG: outer membrane beta-barrel family protein [Bacteroidota bacterium]|nr:outer membrane beta-barrel family protein [Bacteroidota bacterium]
MITKTRVLFLLLFMNAVASGQTIRGKVVDSIQSPIPFATIAVLNSIDSSLVKGSISDDNGNFNIQLNRKGSYLLKITALGFNTKCCDAIQVDSTSVVDLSSIILHSGGINLEEVSVSAIKRTIEFKNGNIIVNIENSPLAKGNTVYDLFSKLPGVSIDDNVIQLNGKTGVVIMLDGRVQQLSNTQLLNMLKSMNAESVEKIELFKNPPAKYDAAGTSGMINIKTKKTKLVGFSGNVYTSASQGFYLRSLSGASLNYRSEKITIFSNLDYNYGYYQSLAKHDKKFRTDSSLTEFNAINTIKDLDQSINYRVGADWLVNKKNIIGFKIDGGPGSYISDANGTNTITNYNNLSFDHLDALVYTPDKWNINNYNINAEHQFDSLGTVLSFTSDYTHLTEKLSSSIQNLFSDANGQQVLPPNIYRSSNISASDILASKLDLTKVIDSLSSFELGAKLGFITTSNNYLFERKDNTYGNYYSDATLSNDYTYAEQTYAAYFNYIRAFKKGSIQLGLRAENTNLTGRNKEKVFELKRRYYNLFPNIALEYAASEDHAFQLNLNRRIDRPEYGNLNPFQYFRDQYDYFEGNPFLLPHYSNTIDITHSYKELLTNTFTYTRIDNVMMPYTEQNDSTKIFKETIDNMKFKNYLAYSFFIQKTLKPWWELSANGLVSYIEYVGKVSGIPFKTASFYYTPSLTNTFTVPKNTKAEVMVFYRSGKNNGLVQVRSRWMLSLAIKKTFFKDKLDCSIGLNDVFYSAYFRTGVKFENQDWSYKVLQDSRRFTININYNFGKLKINERNVESNEEEKGRLSH